MLSGVFFLFILFGNGAIFSEVDDPESLDDNHVALSSYLDSDWTIIPLVGILGAGLLPVLFLVAFRLVGLVCCFLRVSFSGSPDASSLNMGCCGALGFSISKKRKQVPILRADLYAT